jgi:hypothetical protein
MFKSLQNMNNAVLLISRSLVMNAGADIHDVASCNMDHFVVQFL